MAQTGIVEVHCEEGRVAFVVVVVVAAAEDGHAHRATDVAAADAAVQRY